MLRCKVGVLLADDGPVEDVQQRSSTAGSGGGVGSWDGEGTGGLSSAKVHLVQTIGGDGGKARWVLVDGGVRIVILLDLGNLLNELTLEARGWYSKSMPLFNIDIRDQDRILNHVHGVQKLASNMLWHCRTQVKAAWFEKPGDVKGDTSFIDLAYWQKTESVFFQLVTQISDNISNQSESSSLTDSASFWLKQMQNITLSLFDEYALSDLGNNRSMAKRIEARRALTGWLYGGKDIKSFKTKYEIPEKKTEKEGV